MMCYHNNEKLKQKCLLEIELLWYFFYFILFCLLVCWISRILELLSSWVIKHCNKNSMAHSNNILKGSGVESYVKTGQPAQEVLEWLDLATWIKTILVIFWQWMWLLFIFVLRFYLRLNWKKNNGPGSVGTVILK